MAVCLVACQPSVPSAPPVDTGPPLDANRPDVGRDSNTDSSTDVGTDAIVGDVGTDASATDVGTDSASDVGTDAFDPCAGHADCDSNPGCETQLGTTSNCTACHDACTAPTSASAMCNATTGCAWSCNIGYADCDTIPGNGCEVSTNTDPMHCGGCTVSDVCHVSGVNIRATCVGGDCVPTCDSGFADCNNDRTMAGSDGCEINTQTSLANCGSCDNPCTLPVGAMNAHPSCSSAGCHIVCDTGFSDCNSTTADGCEHAAPSC